MPVAATPRTLENTLPMIEQVDVIPQAARKPYSDIDWWKQIIKRYNRLWGFPSCG